MLGENFSNLFGFGKRKEISAPKKDVVEFERRRSFATEVKKAFAEFDEFVLKQLVDRGFNNQSASWLDNFLELQEWAAQLFSKKQDKLQQLEMILSHGTLAGQLVPEQLPGRWSFITPVLNRQVVAELFLQNTELAEALLKTKTIGGHGTKSSTLVDVLLHGIRPRLLLAAKQLRVTSGEAIFAAEGLNKEHISAAQWTDCQTLRSYAESGFNGRLTQKKIQERIKEGQEQLLNSNYQAFQPGIKAKIADLESVKAILSETPKTDLDRLRQYFTRENFPVIYLFAAPNKSYDTSELEQTRNLFIPQSDIRSEFVIKNGVAPEQLTIVLVPEKFIKRVREIVSTLNPQLALSLQVYPLEDYKRLNLVRKLYPEATPQM